jgi:hypothetical protein
VKRRAKIILRSVIAFVVVFGWIGVLIGMQMMSSKGHDFRTETIAVLRLLGQEQGGAQRVYDQASPRFRELSIRESFLDNAANINRVFGPFQEIIADKETEIIDAPAGKTGRLLARLRFANATTTGEFSYHWYEGRWLLLGLTVDIPDELFAEASSPAERAARSTAPPEVLALARSILEQVRDGHGADVYAASAPQFKQSIDEDKFLALLANRTREVGAYVRVLDVNKAVQNVESTRAQVVLVVDFDKVRTTVTFDFIRGDDDSWRLFGFKVVVPEPLIPAIAAEPPTETLPRR